MSTPDKKTSSASTSGATVKKSPQKIAGYEIISKLGQGAMGAVFKARQISMDREVALKLLPPKIAKDAKFIERFQREARASAILNHANIVQGIDVGKDQDTGLWYFAMEFIDGPTLKQVLKKEGRLSEKRVLEIGCDIAKALECAARNKIVHRDIKPDNILVSSQGVPKLADLGLAKKQQSDDASLTQSGMAIGTPHYMAPEQVKGEISKIDSRTDIYSLGATLFHLATGQTPFQGATGAVIMSKVLTEPTPFAHRERKGFGEPLGRLIGEMMHKDMDKRPASPTDLVKQFEHLLDYGNLPSKSIRTKVAKGATTGPRAPIGGARGKSSRTTGPRQPIRSTTGKLNPIKGGDSERSVYKVPEKSSMLPVLAGVGLLILGGLLYLGLSSGKPSASKVVSHASGKNGKLKVKTIKRTADPAVVESVNSSKDHAKKAYRQLSSLAEDSVQERVAKVAAIKKFLSKYDASAWADKSRRLLDVVKARGLVELKPEPESEKVLPVVNDLKKESAEAFALLQKYKGLKESDGAGRLARVEAFLKSVKDPSIQKAAEALQANLKKQQLAEQEMLQRQAKADAAEKYAVFQEAFIALLRAGDQEKALLLLNKAKKNPKLKLQAKELAMDKKAWDWVDGLRTDEITGILALVSVEQFELGMLLGKPRVLGKKEEFQFLRFRNGLIYYGTKGVEFSVKVADLNRKTRLALAELHPAKDAQGNLRRAFGALLMGGEVEGRIKNYLSRAVEGGASIEEVNYINGMLELAEKGSANLAAEKAWLLVTDLKKQIAWKQLPDAIQKFEAQHAGADFTKGKLAEIEDLKRLINKKSGGGNGIFFDFDSAESFAQFNKAFSIHEPGSGGKRKGLEDVVVARTSHSNGKLRIGVQYLKKATVLQRYYPIWEAQLRNKRLNGDWELAVGLRYSINEKSVRFGIWNVWGRDQVKKRVSGGYVWIFPKKGRLQASVVALRSTLHSRNHGIEGMEGPANGTYDRNSELRLRWVKQGQKVTLFVNGKLFNVAPISPSMQARIEKFPVTFGLNLVHLNPGEFVELDNLYFGAPRSKMPAARASDVATADLKKDLVLHHSFNRRKKGVWIGVTRNGHVGKLRGKFSQPPDGLKDVLSLDGSQYLELEHSSSIRFAKTDFTMTAWVRGNFKGRSVILGKVLNKESINGSKFFFIAKGRLVFEAAGQGLRMGTKNIHDANWHHVAVTYRLKEKKITFYLDGIQCGTHDYDTGPLVKGLQAVIGGSPKPFKQFPRFVGLMDDVMIYKRPLNELEMKALFEAFKPGGVTSKAVEPEVKRTKDGVVFLSDLKEANAVVGYGKFGKAGWLGWGKSKIKVKGKPYAKALSTPATKGKKTYASVTYKLGGKFRELSGQVALNDTAVGFKGMLIFEIVCDGKSIWHSSKMKAVKQIQEFHVNVKGVKELVIRVRGKGKSSYGSAHAVWLDPYLK